MSREVVLVVAIGLVGGVTSGLLGVGGGIVMVPGLVALGHLARTRAHASSLAAILPIAVVGTAVYAGRGEVDYGLFGFLSIGSVLGAPLGVRLLARLSERVVLLLFDGIVVAAAIRLLLPASGADAHVSSGLGLEVALISIGVGLIAGAMAGLLGVGGGALLVPAMVVLLERSQHVAAGTSLAVIIPTAIAGSIANARRGFLGARDAALLSLGGVFGAVGGALLALEVDETLLRKLFAVFLLVLAVKSLARGKDAEVSP
ncbi:MAG TPA: sulfite exporter TauE/SafE family protein [Actinomycetota bacterium]|nr:sulfite exporter TauE/SafE family protein [Actinomycetota bacterium]